MLPDGNFHQYDKQHLFSMAGEHHRFSAGKKKEIISYKGWNILPLICYDLRFPAWSKNSWQDGKYGYDLLIYIANWPEARSHAWKSLLPARAIENLAYVAAVNRVGTDGNNIAHSGDSTALDYLGQPLLSLPSHQESIRSITLNKASLDEFRSKFNAGPDWDKLVIQI
jgi:predicted amidohydrolase